MLTSGPQSHISLTTRKQIIEIKSLRHLYLGRDGIWRKFEHCITILQILRTLVEARTRINQRAHMFYNFNDIYKLGKFYDKY